MGSGWCSVGHLPHPAYRTCNLGCLLNFIKPFQNANERTHTSCQQQEPPKDEISPPIPLPPTPTPLSMCKKRVSCDRWAKTEGAWQSCKTYKHRRHVPNMARKSGATGRWLPNESVVSESKIKVLFELAWQSLRNFASKDPASWHPAARVLPPKLTHNLAKQLACI